MSELKNKVMQSIDKNEVKMRPKSFFRIMKALSEIGIVALTLLVIFLVNLSFYLPRRGLGLGLGSNRWEHVFSVIPWWIVILGVSGIGLLTWIIYHYTGAYKKRLAWIIGIVSLVIIITGFLLSVSNFNETLEKGFGQMNGRGQGNGYHRNIR